MLLSVIAPICITIVPHVKFSVHLWLFIFGYAHFWLSHQVEWGEASMIQAERVLLENALMDPSNERFVFLSDR